MSLICDTYGIYAQFGLRKHRLYSHEIRWETSVTGDNSLPTDAHLTDPEVLTRKSTSGISLADQPKSLKKKAKWDTHRRALPPNKHTLKLNVMRQSVLAL